MFDIGWQELIVLGAIALVVFPPKEFPNLLRTLIGVTNKVRETTQELQHHIHNFSKTHLEDITSETEKARNLIHDSSHRIKKQIQDLENRAKAAAKNPNPKKSSKTPTAKAKAKTKSLKSPTTATPISKAKTKSPAAVTATPKAPQNISKDTAKAVSQPIITPQRKVKAQTTTKATTKAQTTTKATTKAQTTTKATTKATATRKASSPSSVPPSSST